MSARMFNVANISVRCVFGDVETMVDVYDVINT